MRSNAWDGMDALRWSLESRLILRKRGFGYFGWASRDLLALNTYRMKDVSHLCVF